MICLGKNGDDPHTFLGAMLTSAKKKANNVPMKDEHFEKNDAEGNPWKMTYKESLIFERLFTKSVKWHPF